MKKITLLFSFLALCSTSILTAQFNYSEEAEELLSVEPISNKNSVDVMIILDCSGSMVGKPIDDLNNALTGFFNDMRGNNQVSLGIITFETSARMIRSPKMVTDYEQVPYLTANGYTNMTNAFEVAEYQLKNSGRSAYKPIVIVLTDGMPDNPTTTLQAAASLRQQAHVFVVGVNGADLNFLTKISGSTDLAGIAKNTDVYNLFFQEMVLSLQQHIEDNSEVLLSTSKSESVPFKVSNRTGWKK